MSSGNADSLMNNPSKNKFEVRIPKWEGFPSSIDAMRFPSSTGPMGIPPWTGMVVVTILLLFAFFPLYNPRHMSVWTFPLLIILVTMISASISLVFRKRPLFVIDNEGIFDYGMYSQGYRLIRWENIEAITPRLLPSRGKTLSMFLKVNNFDELVSQRNLFFRPFCLLSAFRNGFYGAPILLSVTWGDKSIEDISHQIAIFSKSKIQVPKPLSLLASLPQSLVLFLVDGLGVLGIYFCLIACLISSAHK